MAGSGSSGRVGATAAMAVRDVSGSDPGNGQTGPGRGWNRQGRNWTRLRPDPLVRMDLREQRRRTVHVRMLLAVGLSVVVPPGWHVAHPALLEPCTNPAPRFALARGVRDLVVVQEALDRASVSRFPPRPRRFRVARAPSFLTCCAPARRQKGWMLSFRDHGRSFYAYVYGDARRGLAVLDTLRIS